MQKMQKQRGFVGTLALFALALLAIIGWSVSKSSSEGAVSTSTHDAKALASMISEQSGSLKNGVTIMQSGVSADVQGLYLDTTVANDVKLKVQTAAGVQDGGYPVSVPSLAKGLAWQFYGGNAGLYAFVDGVPASACAQIEALLNNPSATTGATAAGDATAAGALTGGAVSNGAISVNGSNTSFDGVTAQKGSCVMANAAASTGRFVTKLQ